MIRHPLSHMGHEGARHRVAEPTRRERRVKRLLAIAGRTHAAVAARLDRFNDEARQLGASKW